MTARLWPVAPLVDAAGRTVPDLLAVTGLSRHTIYTRRTLTDVEADRAAVALGLHPAEIWSDWHAAALSVPDWGAAIFAKLRQESAA